MTREDDIDRRQRQLRQREAAQALGAFLRTVDRKPAEQDRALIEASNDIALRDACW
jgi:hypothetical protein